jgi:hypothetical protein
MFENFRIRNGDGVLDADELAVLLQKSGQIMDHNNDGVVDESDAKAIDKNNDGKLSLDEFLEAGGSKEEFEKYDMAEDRDAAAMQVCQQLLLQFKGQLMTLNHNGVIDPDTLQLLKDSVDELLDGGDDELLEGGDLVEWWSSKLQPEADKLMRRWEWLPSCGVTVKGIKLQSSLQAVETCLGFIATVHTVAEMRREAWSDSGKKEDHDDYTEFLRQLDARLVLDLETSADMARSWLSQQPATLVAMAETQKELQKMFSNLEHEAESMFNQLGEVENQALLHEIRDLRVAHSKSYIATVQLHEDMEAQLTNDHVRATLEAARNKSATGSVI